MKKTIITLASIPILVIALHYCITSIESNHKAQVVTTQSNGFSSQVDAQKDDLKISHRAELTRKKNLEEDNILEKAVIDHTFASAAKIADLAVANLEPEFRKLFKNWKLDEDTIQKILTVIYQRKLEEQQEELRYYKERPTEVTDAKRLNEINAKHNTKSDAIVRTSEIELAVLLGSLERVKQLAATEDAFIKKSFASDAQKMREIRNKRVGSND